MPKPKDPVYANNRSIVHAGDDLEHIAAPPDTCQTPTPTGPQPTPYVNIAKSSNLKKGTKRVKIGGKSVAIQGAEITTSSGNDPGTIGGLASGTNKGKATWFQGSPNVRFEGKPVVRFLDPILHNGNTYNTAFQTNGHTGYAYADDFDGACPICNEGPERHRILEHESTVELCSRLIAALKAERKRPGASRVTNPRCGGYMIAVMICKCKQSWAAMSGTETLEGFLAVADQIVDRAVPGGPATLESLWAANRSPITTASADVFAKTWRGIESLLSDTARDKTYGFSQPGNCAAAKLLAHAAGHVPVSLTERFFVPKGRWRSSYRFRQTELSPSELASLSPIQLGMVMRNVLSDPNQERLFMSREDHIDTAGSCHTCQDLLYLTMCGKDDRSCG